MFGWFKPSSRVVTVQDAKELLRRGEVLFVDVRELDEWNAGHIPGAMHVPLSRFEREATDIPVDRRVILYCRSGMRSGKALGICRKLGLSIDTHLRGGIIAWNAAGPP